MFITFEGIEGSGKSLQIGRMQAYLAQHGKQCVLTREPGGTEFGRAVRQVLLRTGGARREPISELLLYLADRYQNLREIVEPALRSGTIVLCDRYHDATRVYQGAARGVPLAVIDSLAQILRIPEPDRTVLLDLDPELGLERARRRNVLNDVSLEEGRFEAEALGFHHAVRDAYLDLARRFPERIQVVAASGTPDDVFGRIKPLLDQWI